MVRVNILRDALRKHRIGLIDKDELLEVNLGVFTRMEQYLGEIKIWRAKLREYEPRAYEEYQKITFETSREIEHWKFNKVLQLATTSQRLKAKLADAIEAIESLDTAQKLLKRLQTELLSQWLEKMLSIQILKNCMKDARELMSKKEYAQSVVLLRFCAIEINNSYNPKSNIDQKKEQIIKQIEHLKQICSDTYEYSKMTEGVQIEISGKPESILLRLLEEGRINFVIKLVDDFAMMLKIRKSFRDRLDNYPPDIPMSENHLTEALRLGGWTEGTNYLLSNNLKQLQSRLEKLDTNLNH